MIDLYKLVSTFVEGVTLIMALVLIIGLFQRANRAGLVHNILMGCVFSGSILYTMSDPIFLPGGSIYDMRTLLIGSAFALLGPTVGIMAVVTGIAYRWGIGGPAANIGIIGIVFTFMGAGLWRYAIRDRSWPNWQKSILLGILISANSFAIWFVPTALQLNLVINLVPYIFASNILGCLLLHYLISGELTFARRAEQSHQDASTDHLTGLLNRRGLDLKYPEMAMHGDTGKGWGFLCFDLDKFKDINDTHGHAVGDAVLRHVSEKVSSNLRPHDAFARLGGDEFAVVLNQIDAKEAEMIAKRCCKVVTENGFEYRGETLPISISVGGIWMLDQIQIDWLMEEADKALYAAKSAGRNRVVFKSGIDNAPQISLGAPA